MSGDYPYTYTMLKVSTITHAPFLGSGGSQTPTLLLPLYLYTAWWIVDSLFMNGLLS